MIMDHLYVVKQTSKHSFLEIYIELLPKKTPLILIKGNGQTNIDYSHKS